MLSNSTPIPTRARPPTVTPPPVSPGPSGTAGQPGANFADMLLQQGSPPPPAPVATTATATSAAPAAAASKHRNPDTTPPDGERQTEATRLRRPGSRPPTPSHNPAAGPRDNDANPGRTAPAESDPSDPRSAAIAGDGGLQALDGGADADAEAEADTQGDPSLVEFTRLFGLPTLTPLPPVAAPPADDPGLATGTAPALVADARSARATDVRDPSPGTDPTSAASTTSPDEPGSGEAESAGQFVLPTPSPPTDTAEAQRRAVRADGASSGNSSSSSNSSNSRADTLERSATAAEPRGRSLAAQAMDSARRAEQGASRAQSLTTNLEAAALPPSTPAQMAVGQGAQGAPGGQRRAPFNPEASVAGVTAFAQQLALAAAPAAESAAVPVHSPLHSPAFAPELAARVSLLASQGVQSAELQLNPAEMGPVSVQIVVEGQQAQVSFHASQADTRQALEQGLPDLAAALRDGGLTLSGGGVFQQSAFAGGRESQGREGGAAAGERQRNGNSTRTLELELDTSATRAAAPSRRTALLDTYV